MKLVAQAPGKLVLLGEYAVLEDAPALALAVDRQARVTLSTSKQTDCDLVLEAPDIGVDMACADMDSRGQLHWRTLGCREQQLQLVTQIWNTLAARSACPLAGVRLQIHNAGFFDRDARGRSRKLGLGSSAALTVALAAVLAAAHEPPPDAGDEPTRRGEGVLRPDPTQLIRLHRRWQQTQGSGIDIATSLTGGLICYRQPWNEAPAQVQAVHWPPAGTYCAFIWSGEAVSTTHSLQHLAQWRAQSPSVYRARMGELCELAHTLPLALAGKATDFVQLVANYGAALARLADASGLTILTARQVQLSRLAAKEGVSYKPCGAGGDVGVAVADDPDRLERLRPHLAHLALRILPLSVASQGLQIHRIADALAPARNPIGY